MIVGLGNPDPEHLMTRHNAGFWFIDALANKLSLTFSPDRKFQSELCRYQSGSTDCWLCKPQTHMNESGTAVQALLSYYKIPMDQILVVHDEIDLDVGNVRFKTGGGHGGNNGIRDIIQKTGDKDFNRLRIGIGHPGSPDKVVSYVLGKPSRDDEDSILNGITNVISEHEKLFDGQIQKLMNQLNKKNNTE
jgi:peptidyl-tRNA hydrolase, PTH1 family